MTRQTRGRLGTILDWTVKNSGQSSNGPRVGVSPKAGNTNWIAGYSWLTADVFNKEAAVKGPGNEKKWLGRKMGDPGVHELGHTVRQRLQSGGRGSWRKSVVMLKTSFLYFSSRPAAVWSYSVTSIKSPPLPSSLIKGVNNHPSLTVYYPPRQ